MLNKSRFKTTLERAQLKIAQSVNLSIEKLDTYWEEFKDCGITDEQFEECVKAVSRQSKFFPKVAEIWEEVTRLKPRDLVPRLKVSEMDSLTQTPEINFEWRKKCQAELLGKMTLDRNKPYVKGGIPWEYEMGSGFYPALVGIDLLVVTSNLEVDRFFSTGD